MNLQTVFINCLYLLGQRELTEHFREGCEQAYKELHRGDKNE